MEEEHPPELPPEPPGGEWVKMPEVAALLGMSERAARDWVKRHDIPCRGERPITVSVVAIRACLAAMGKSPEEVPEGPEVPGSPSGWASGDPDRPIDVPFRVVGGSDRPLVPLDTMLDQVRGLGDQLAALAGRNEELALEVGALRERVGHRDAAVARLEAERDALQAEVGRLRSGQDAPVAAPDAPHEAEPAGAARRDSRPWWRFWGRG